MATQAPPPLSWHDLSHHDRYRRLKTVRRVWFRYHPYDKTEDRSDRVVYLDGRWIDDAPSLHLALGEAFNGPSGYFGGNLDGLDDCLFGGFGVTSPVTIRLSHFDKVRAALDRRASGRWRAEGFYKVVAAGESQQQLIDWGYLPEDEAGIAEYTALYEAAFADEPFDTDAFRPYFEGFLAVLEDRGVKLVPVEDETTE